MNTKELLREKRVEILKLQKLCVFASLREL